MSCQRFQELFHGYLDGELNDLQTSEVASHIDHCEVCRVAYSNQISLSSSLKDPSLYYRAPEKLRKQIRQSLKKEGGTEVARTRLRWGWLVPAASLALLVILVTLWNVVPLLQRSASEELLVQEIVSDHIRSLQMPNHLLDVISTDQHTVKPWFNGKVDFSPPVQDFAEQDFRLYGGRLEYLNNRTVATLIYQRRSHYINLYIWPADKAQAGENTSQHQGYNLIHFTSAGLNFWAISDLNKVELVEFARLVQQSQ